MKLQSLPLLFVSISLHAFVVGGFVPTTSKIILQSTKANVVASSPRTPSLLHTSSDEFMEVEDARDELLKLLLKRFRSKAAKEEENRIEYLMNFLKNANTSFDPEKCLNGELYVALYAMGPQPFWERLTGLSFGGGRKNIKGQKYFNDGNGNYNVRNYAEFLGKDFSVEAVGKCVKDEEPEIKENEEKVVEERPGFFARVFGGESVSSNDSDNSVANVVTCPANYTIDATGLSFNVFQNKLNFDIEGRGYMRMLYADEELRILDTPKDTESAGGAIDEKAGLLVAQVRVDLIDPEFSLP
ncbi:hypothetical protein CTEN210_10520 [Chaetoceros tenuissimus]|uniref:Plastid lipid-associated protein/fibrillin conserved domain-containing protein n=1 Tax=Chaetoceros tenuissimus TaxID=426638 RepID=A0AAD3D0T6_9STRA|nr:hypothetical protein CTEN210_10520 [Chaetoceros tenuissimus]